MSLDADFFSCRGGAICYVTNILLPSTSAVIFTCAVPPERELRRSLLAEADASGSVESSRETAGTGSGWRGDVSSSFDDSPANHREKRPSQRRVKRPESTWEVRAKGRRAEGISLFECFTLWCVLIFPHCSINVVNGYLLFNIQFSLFKLHAAVLPWWFLWVEGGLFSRCRIAGNIVREKFWAREALQI